jgi:hypothetical protein
MEFHVTKAIWGLLCTMFLILQLSPLECFRGPTKPSREPRTQTVGKADEGSHLTSNGFHTSCVPEILNKLELTKSRKHLECLLWAWCHAQLPHLRVSHFHCDVYRGLAQTSFPSLNEACLDMDPKAFTSTALTARRLHGNWRKEKAMFLGMACTVPVTA